MARARMAMIDEPDVLDLAGAIAAPEPWVETPIEPSAPFRRDRVVPTLAWVVAVAWIAGALFVTRSIWATLPAPDAIELAAAIAVVPVLIGMLYVLAMRGGHVEGDRLARTTAAMRAQSASLQRDADAMAATLEGNRLALSEQWARLSTLGEIASERLGAIGTAMVDDVALAESSAARLAQAGDGSAARIEALLAALPQAETAARALAMLIDDAGQAAATRITELEARMQALAEQGERADTIARGAAATLAEHSAAMTAKGLETEGRLGRTAQEMNATVDALLGRVAGAIDDAHRGIAAQGEAMLAMVGAHQASLDAAARSSAEALAGRIRDVDNSVDRLSARLEEQRIGGDALIEGLRAGLDDVDARLEALHRQGAERSQLLAASISALGGSADAMTESLRAGEAMATRTIGTTETLLIALDSAAREIDETLPEALDRLDTRIADSKRVVAQAKPELLALVTAAESTHDAIEAIAGVIGEQRRTLDQLSATLLDTLATGRSKADALGEVVDETIERSNRFADDAAPRLIDALLRVRDTASVAADKARETLAEVIPAAADQLGEAAAGAMARATEDGVARQLNAIRTASEAAAAATGRAAEQLSRQVQAIVDHSAIVETRITDARKEREEGERDTFTRRSAMLIEAMNSAAIDIVKAFAPDVSDSAWAAYLKGDRGVFTRRAVRILDAGHARDIARLYDADLSFRDMVNRYIHDFEAMLRQVLSHSDGSPLGVTLLSSDMGKLYVALAQAIERLR